MKSFHYRRALLSCLVGSLAGLGAVASVAADADFPQQPITIVVPFAPGGSLDATARVLGNKLKDTLGQPVVIANRPGAGSAVGARVVASAKPDGYTLFIASGSAFGFAHLLVKSFDYRLKDFAPIAGLAVYTSLFAVNMNVPAKTLPELVALAGTKPSGLSICSTGNSGLNHLQLEMFKGLVKRKQAGTPFNVTHVPYNGVAPALTALKAGDVDACVLPYSALVKNMDGAGLRVIAVQRGKRLPALPNAGTTGEQGFAEMDGNDQLVTLSAPAGTPPQILRKIESALRSAMSDSSVFATLTDMDVQPTFVKSADAQKWLEDDVKKLSTIIQEVGLGAQ
jgi:tripartite-type tricarboxylate transporter receptor subunit TctC